MAALSRDQSIQSLAHANQWQDGRWRCLLYCPRCQTLVLVAKRTGVHDSNIPLTAYLVFRAPRYVRLPTASMGAVAFELQDEASFSELFVRDRQSDRPLHIVTLSSEGHEFYIVSEDVAFYPCEH